MVADNTSAGSFVIGERHLPDVDISNLGMLLEIDGKVLEVGSSAAILGHPARALAQASALLAEHELSLRPGDIVLAGAATATRPIAPSQSIRAVVQALGNVSFSCRP